MNLLTALAIYFGEVPELRGQMKEAVKTIQFEKIRSDSMLCEETVRALKKLKKGKQ